MLSVVQALIKESESEALKERRAADRRFLTRPVVVMSGRDRDHIVHTFSRDISSIGIGLVSQCEWHVGEFGLLTIHSLVKQPQRVIAQVRWCRDYGKGWYLTGWLFVSEA